MSSLIPALIVALERAHLEVLGHRHPREEPAALRRLGDPALDDLVRGDAVISSPWKRSSPARGRFSPLIERSVVVLPAPFAPSSVTISPSCTSSEMPLRAWIEP